MRGWWFNVSDVLVHSFISRRRHGFNSNSMTFRKCVRAYWCWRIWWWKTRMRSRRQRRCCLQCCTGSTDPSGRNQSASETLCTANKQHSTQFLARDSVHSALYAIARPSVRLSVTGVDQSKTVEVRIMPFSPYSSLIPLVWERDCVFCFVQPWQKWRIAFTSEILSYYN